MTADMRIAYTACPLCDATALRHETTGDCSRHVLYKREIPARMTWLRCEACDHVFTDGYFTPEAAALIFTGTQTHQRLGHDIEMQRMIAARMVESVLPYVAEGAWLDVGFGNGALLFTAQEFGFTPIGLDLRSENVAARARRVKTPPEA